MMGTLCEVLVAEVRVCREVECAHNQVDGAIVVDREVERIRQRGMRASLQDPRGQGISCFLIRAGMHSVNDARKGCWELFHASSLATRE
jgi:hypothetical protein